MTQTLLTNTYLLLVTDAELLAIIAQADCECWTELDLLGKDI